MSMPSYDPNNDPSAQPVHGQQQPYGAQQGYGEPARPARNGLGIAALVLGILAVVTFWMGFFIILIVIPGLFGIVAIVLGVIGRKRAKRGEATNGGVALWGVILGAVGLVLAIGSAIITGAFLNSSGGGDYLSCVSDANGDQATITQCANDFQQNVQNGN